MADRSIKYADVDETIRARTAEAVEWALRHLSPEAKRAAVVTPDTMTLLLTILENVPAIDPERPERGSLPRAAM